MEAHYQKHLFFCVNQKTNGKKCCNESAANELFLYAKKKLQLEGLHGKDKCRVSSSGCLGRCALGPCLVIYPEGIWYKAETTQDIDEIIECHLINNQVVRRLKIELEPKPQ